MAAIALLIAGTVGAIVLLGSGVRLDGAVLDQTFAPAPSAAAVVVTTPSPTPLPLPVVVESPMATPVATLSLPTPTPAQVVQPSPKITPRPTARPTPRPVKTAAAGPARDPAETVDRFYDLVVAHDYDAAAALWSPRMRAEYPTSRYIDGRFDATTRIDVNRLRTDRMSVARREAVVSIDITEYRTSGAPRHWFGTWDLVLIDGAWWMDDPHLAGG